MAPPRMMGDGRKAKNPKQTLSRLLGYLKPFKLTLILVVICVCVAAFAQALSSKSLEYIIDDYIKPLVGQADPDFGPLVQFLLTLGGIYVPHAHAFTGGKAVQEIGNMIISKAFLGASAVDGVFGVSNNLSYEIDLKRAVAEQAEKVILMVGGEKLGKRAAMKICAVDRLYAIVTDRKPEPELLALLEEKGVKVIY